MLRLRISRNTVSLEGGARRRVESTRALVALTVDRNRVGIVAVGEEKEEVEKRLIEFEEASKRGIRGQIIAAAESRLAASEEETTPAIRFVRPGDDPWWDERWKNPYSLRHGDPRRAGRPREVLLVEPLHPDSWSPHLIRGLLMYVLWTSPWLRGKTWPAFRRPTIEVEVAEDIEGVDFEEVIDQLRGLWGASRVVLVGDPQVRPLPLTTMQLTHRISRTVWWAALALMVVLAQLAEGQASPGAIIAAAVAAIALIASRIAKGRSEAERPRRQARARG